MNPTVHEMVRAALIAGGFDGLYCEDECACLLGDLSPCFEMHEDCRAGYKIRCDCHLECDFHVGPAKDADHE